MSISISIFNSISLAISISICTCFYLSIFLKGRNYARLPSKVEVARSKMKHVNRDFLKK